MFPFEQFSFEMLVVLALGLMILGPKDLPVVLRKIGQFVAKMRGMANEFRASFDELARQSELDELRKEVEALRTGNYGQTASPPPDPIYDYKPYDDAAAGLDSASHAALPETVPAEPAIVGEGLPTEAQYPVSERPRRRRTPRAEVAAEEAAPAAAEAAPPAKPARKPRTKKPAAAPVDPPAADAAE